MSTNVIESWALLIFSVNQNTLYLFIVIILLTIIIISEIKIAERFQRTKLQLVSTFKPNLHGKPERSRPFSPKNGAVSVSKIQSYFWV